MLKKFKESLINDSVTIKKEIIDDGINIIIIDKLPWKSLKKIKSNRRKVYKYDSFIVKTADKQKFSSETKSDLEELKLEILAAKKFKEDVPILEKLCIIQENSEKTFLIEELLVSYDEFKRNTQLKDKASYLLESTKKIFKSGDFKIENIVYDKKTKKLLFTDVFPSEAHLIGKVS